MSIFEYFEDLNQKHVIMALSSVQPSGLWWYWGSPAGVGEGLCQGGGAEDGSAGGLQYPIGSESDS